MELYNEINKECFIMEMVSSDGLKYLIRDLFRQTSKFEEQYSKDIAEMNINESREIVSSLEIKTLGTVYQIRSIINTYLKWCDKNMVFDNISDGFLKALSTDSNDISQVLWFKDSDDLYYSMRKVREFDNGYPEPVVFVLAWLGISKSDAYHLKDEQVDLESRKIYDNTGNILASCDDEKLFDILVQYSKCDVGFRENRTCSYKVIKDPSCEFFLKKYSSADSPKFGTPFTNVQLDSSISRFSEKYIEMGNSNRFKYTNVWESGRLHEIWKLEQAGFNIDLKENQSQIVELFKNTKQFRNIMWEYKTYKRFFNLYAGKS